MPNGVLAGSSPSLSFCTAVPRRLTLTYVSEGHRSQPKTQTARRVGKIAWPTVDGAPCRRAIPGRRRGQVLPTRAAHVGTAREIFHARNIWGCAVAVGMLIAEHPPHRSGRAAFPHTAPTRMSDGEAPIRPRMKNVGLRKPIVGN